MRCQHINDATGKQCSEQATRDIRIATARHRWRLWLCDEHHNEEVSTIRDYIDRMAVEQEELKQ